MPEFILEILNSGGLLPYLKAKKIVSKNNSNAHEF
jgi:hypothetical protein